MRANTLSGWVIRIGGVAAALVLVVGAAHRLSAQQARATVDGAYELRLSAMKAEEATRLAVIGQSVAKLEPAIAKRWGGMMEIMSLPQRRLRIATLNGEIAVTKGDRPPLKSPESGSARALNESNQLTQKVEAGVLVQRVTSTALDREQLGTPLQVTRRYSLTEDRQTLTVQTRIEGAVIPQPVVYDATYDRI